MKCLVKEVNCVTFSTLATQWHKRIKRTVNLLLPLSYLPPLICFTISPVSCDLGVMPAPHFTFLKKVRRKKTWTDRHSAETISISVWGYNALKIDLNTLKIPNFLVSFFPEIYFFLKKLRISKVKRCYLLTGNLGGDLIGIYNEIAWQENSHRIFRVIFPALKYGRFDSISILKFKHFICAIILGYFSAILGHRCRFLGSFVFLNKPNFEWRCWIRPEFCAFVEFSKKLKLNCQKTLEKNFTKWTLTLETYPKDKISKSVQEENIYETF